MIRNLKVLGLALVAVFAFSAVAASAASAQQGDVTSDGPVTLTGEEGPEGPAKNFLSAFGGKVVCPGSTYTGHQVLTHEETTTREEMEETLHPFLPEHFRTTTITPHYDQENCSAGSGLFQNVTVDMNGCDFVLHLGETTDVDEYAVISDLVCPSGKEVTVTIFRNAAEHETGNAFCTMHIKPQAGLTGAELKDETNGHLLLTGEIENIHITGTDPEAALFCPVPGTEATSATGKLSLEVTIKGHNEEGGSTGLSISENEA